MSDGYCKLDEDYNITQNIASAITGFGLTSNEVGACDDYYYEETTEEGKKNHIQRYASEYYDIALYGDEIDQIYDFAENDTNCHDAICHAFMTLTDDKERNNEEIRAK